MKLVAWTARMDDGIHKHYKTKQDFFFTSSFTFLVDRAFIFTG